MEKRNSKKIISNTTEGITLIALIITIIVLLILAGITIDLIIGQDGILKRTEEAGKNYVNAAENERIQLNEFLNEADKIIANVTGESSEGKNVLVKEITLNKTTTEINVGGNEKLIATITPINASNKNVTWTTSNETVATVTDGLVTAVSPGIATITATALDGSGKKASCEVIIYLTASVLEAGDYIKYDTGISTVGENGVLTCRVLYLASSEYGLQIISDKNVKKVTLGSSVYSESVKSYNNAIEDLNDYAEDYINPDYAYDARCVGSIPITENGIFTQKDSGATTYVSFSNPNYIKSLYGDTNYETDVTKMTEVGIKAIDEQYWLASRNYTNYGSNTNGEHYFGITGVDANGDLSGLCTMYANWGSHVQGAAYECGIRPCISLKSDIIKIVGGTGEDADNAYIIRK